MKAVILTRGRIATVDDEDFDRVNQFKWHARKSRRGYYGQRNLRLSDGSWGQEFLHTFILGVKGADHKDGDGLDNRRENLRPATPLQNLRGQRKKKVGAFSQYRGVTRASGKNKWCARIGVNGRTLFLGVFMVEEDAARAYDAAARTHFKEFAAPNFI